MANKKLVSAAEKSLTVTMAKDGETVKGVTKVTPKAEKPPKPTLSSFLAGLEPKMRASVQTHLTNIEAIKREVGMSLLKIGKELSELSKALKGQFVEFLKLQNSLSTATAYRYKNAWEVAQAALPVRVINLALAEHIDITSGNANDKPFGKFQDAIEQLGSDDKAKELLKMAAEGKGKEADQAAEQWLGQVTTLQRKLASNDIDKKVASYNAEKGQEYHRDAIAAFNRNYAKVPQDKQHAWTLRFLQYAVTLAQLGETTISPTEVPEEVFKPKKVKKESKQAEKAKAAVAGKKK